MRPVRDRPVVVERGVDLADRFQHRGLAADVEKRLLLSGEGRIGQIFGSCRGPDRKRDFTRALICKLLIKSTYFCLQRLRQRRFLDPSADLGTALLQATHVLRIQCAHASGNALAQTLGGEEFFVSPCGGGEAFGHADAGVGEAAEHFPERGVLAAHFGEVRHAQVAQPPGVRFSQRLLLLARGSYFLVILPFPLILSARFHRPPSFRPWLNDAPCFSSRTAPGLPPRCSATAFSRSSRGGSSAR